MEMVKVDVQKLQLLNDRIAQTIDALNQVRLSVHGIQHTSPTTPPPWANPYGAYGVQPYGLQQNPYGAPFAPSFSQISPFAGFAQFSPYGPGIQHTTGYPTGYPTPYPTNFNQGFNPGFTQGFSPYQQQQIQPSFTRVPTWSNGLSHTTGWEPRMGWMS